MQVKGISNKELFAPGHRACAGCMAALVARHTLKAAGENTIVISATGCLEVFSTPYPQSAWKVPWIHGAFENNSAIGSGVDHALRALKKRDKTNVLVIGGDGATFDIGFGALSGTLERGDRICHICYDNGAYMNCLSLDTFVTTENGLKKITDIKLGEKVYAFDQKTHQLVLKRCSGIFDNGIKKVYQVQTLHHSIKATDNHPFLTIKRNGLGKEATLEWKILDKLEIGDEIIILKNTISKESYTFKQANISNKSDFKVHNINKITLPAKSSPELMEFLGLYLGGGWVRSNKAGVGFTVPKNTKARAKLINLCKKLFNDNIIRIDDLQIMLYSTNLAKFIESLGFGRGAKNKVIAPWVFTLPLKEKEAFIKGLLSSDGHTIGKSHKYVSASIDLLQSLRLLLQTMGYLVGKIHQQIKKKGTFVVYRKLLEDSTYGYIYFNKKTKANTKKFLPQTKQSDFFADNDDFSTEKIQSIDYIKEEPTIDLRVDGEHNFIADGIVVHNTGVQRSGATPKFASTTTSPAGSKIHGKQQGKKPLPLIVAAHGAYVATANIAYVHDYIKKVQKGLAQQGPAYIQVYAPCTRGWGYLNDKGIDIAKEAFNSCVTPLYEIEDGILKFNQKPTNKKPVNDYLKAQTRFKHVNEAEITEIQKNIDEHFALLEKLEECHVKL